MAIWFMMVMALFDGKITGIRARNTVATIQGMALDSVMMGGRDSAAF
ncbi:hypothetical protein LCL97_21220 [Seohaeicola saemankumensis]|nr:hypothetical protein [Seohaeicola saemankumensis]MCA0873360.1 hypothetical protein [Seohaeicola saemankumensis]